MRLHFDQTDIAGSFDLLGLPAAVVQALDETGYETPSRLQSACIPLLLQGRDVLAQTCTGMGKTLSFVLPLLAAVRPEMPAVQVLVLTPNDEMSLHVCEIFQTYARHLDGFHVLPVYHQSSSVQLRQLQRGCQVVVGTPPRVAHFLDDGYFATDGVRMLVLDEADTMLREGMGDALRVLLPRLPQDAQTALFVSSMFRELELFAASCLKSPVSVDVRAPLPDLPHLRLRYWLVDGRAKLNALARVVEVEPGFDAGLVCVHHTNTAQLLAEKLLARGYATAHVASGTSPHQRVRIAEQLAGGEVDLLVATDSAAWQSGSARFTHLVNFDMPVDLESYAHRLRHLERRDGKGTVVFLVTAREMGMLHCIEQAAGLTVKPLELPERLR